MLYIDFVDHNEREIVTLCDPPGSGIPLRVFFGLPTCDSSGALGDDVNYNVSEISYRKDDLL